MGEIQMIVKAEIINQPYSGQFNERVYDIQSRWNSQDWTWVKFVENDFTEWCGEFRGQARGIALSAKYNIVLVLTSDYLYQLDCISGDIMEYESQSQYQSLTVSPSGDFILADYYSIEIIESILKEKKTIESPIEMDLIKFLRWTNNKLSITCKEFLNWDNDVVLELDGFSFEIIIKTD
jgi:hypothetical protein